VPFFHGWPAPALAALGVVMEAREYNTAEVTTRIPPPSDDLTLSFMAKRLCFLATLH
jgi:hypothetical protein